VQVCGGCCKMFRGLTFLGTQCKMWISDNLLFPCRSYYLAHTDIFSGSFTKNSQQFLTAQHNHYQIYSGLQTNACKSPDNSTHLSCWNTQHISLAKQTKQTETNNCHTHAIPKFAPAIDYPTKLRIMNSMPQSVKVSQTKKRRPRRWQKSTQC